MNRDAQALSAKVPQKILSESVDSIMVMLTLLSLAPLLYSPTTSVSVSSTLSLGPHWRLRAAARVTSMSEFGIEAVTSLAAATAAASGGSMSLLLPSTDLLSSKRPLGSSQLTRGAMSWLTRESRWMAQNYLYFIEQETLGFISVSEEAELLVLLRDRFSVSALRLHLQRRLAEAPPEAGLRLAAADVAAARAGAEVGSRHNPTVWVAFQLGVQHLLTERAQSLEPVAKVRREGGIGASDGLEGSLDCNGSLDWRADVEWVLLQQIGVLDAADSAASLAAALPTGSVKPVRQGAAPPKPRQPPKQATESTKQATESKQPPQANGASTQAAQQTQPAPAPPTPAPAQRPSKQPKQPKAQPQPAQLAQPPSAAEDRSEVQTKGDALAATVATVAAGGRGGGKAVPRPNAKQPLGRREVGAPTLQWLGIATERCAVEYLAMADQLCEAPAPKDEEQAMEGRLRALRPRFGIVPLVRRVDEILTRSGPPPVAAAEHAERVRQHVPTVWASFSSAVRALLQIRYESSAALGLSATGSAAAAAAPAVGGVVVVGGGGSSGGSGGCWSNSSAWLLLRQLYASSKEDKAFRWSVSERQASRQPAATAKKSKSLSSAKAETKAEIKAETKAETKAEVAAARAVAAATLVAAGEKDAPTLSASAYLAALALEAPPGTTAGEAWPSWNAADVDVPPLAPLPARAPLPGSAALLAAVGTYTTRLSRLLRQEREAALELAEKAVAAAELDAGPEDDDEDEALVVAATVQEQATAAAALRTALRKSAELRAEARLRQLRGGRGGGGGGAAVGRRAHIATATAERRRQAGALEAAEAELRALQAKAEGEVKGLRRQLEEVKRTLAESGKSSSMELLQAGVVAERQKRRADAAEVALAEAKSDAGAAAARAVEQVERLSLGLEAARAAAANRLKAEGDKVAALLLQLASAKAEGDAALQAAEEAARKAADELQASETVAVDLNAGVYGCDALGARARSVSLILWGRGRRVYSKRQ